MASGVSQNEAEKTRIMLGLLDSIERGGQSQRRLAVELGVALGLVNAYLKRCINKGLIKVSEIPARRYAYYLTPQGFAEKSRLTAEYLSYSLEFFRKAKGDCRAIFQAAAQSGFRRVVLAGKSDLAEIAAICALETGTEIVAVVDAGASEAQFVGRPLVNSLDAVVGQYDAVILTDQSTTQKTYDELKARVGEARVLIPEVLRGRLPKAEGQDP
ncbi:MAG TPA: winged helix-turn-helix transcriptional regulator [Pseudolabrys sp.]|nr:winged helix-turn-helix transcriptional regulator [Pseudolabrys sp.]